MAEGALSRAGLVRFGGLAVLVALPQIAGALDEPYFIGLFTRVLIYALAAVSLDLILGFGGMVSFGHGAFFGVGAYATGILIFHATEASPVVTWPVTLMGTDQALLAWPASIVAAALAALAIGAVSLRTGGVYFIMITLAFAQMLYYFSVSLEAYGGDDGLSLWGRNRLGPVALHDPMLFYYLCLALLVGFIYLCRRVVESRFGMVIRGARENQRRMAALGFGVYAYKLVCFVIAGAGAGLAGALIANQTEFVSPGLMHWTRSGEIIVMVVLGGMGTLIGPVFGAAALLLLEEVLSAYTEHWTLFLGLLLVFVILFARRGLYGWLAGPGAGRG